MMMASAGDKEKEFAAVFPKASAVYAKSIFVSVPDVTSAFTVTNDGMGAGDGKFKVITLYVWSNI